MCRDLFEAHHKRGHWITLFAGCPICPIKHRECACYKRRKISDLKPVHVPDLHKLAALLWGTRDETALEIVWGKRKSLDSLWGLGSTRRRAYGRGNKIHAHTLHSFFVAVDLDVTNSRWVRWVFVTYNPDVVQVGNYFWNYMSVVNSQSLFFLLLLIVL